MIEKIAYDIASLWSYQRMAAAFAAGAFSALALPPYNLYPILAITLPVLIWLLDGAVSEHPKTYKFAIFNHYHQYKIPFVIGWFFGFGYFLASLYWVSFAFLQDPNLNPIFMPFALILLPFGLALFPAFACMIARLYWLSDFQRVLSISFFFALFEWLRGNFITDFPWNLIGYSLTSSDAFSQLTSVIGIYGLSLFTLICFSSFSLIVNMDSNKENALPKWGIIAIIITALAAAWLAGNYRLNSQIQNTENDLKMRLVQPNIDHQKKWDANSRKETTDIIFKLSDMATSPTITGTENMDVLIWPETALPYLIEQDIEIRERINTLLNNNTMLITGAITSKFLPPDTKTKYYNSIIVFNKDGSIATRYNKSHLVPFGEYIPFQEIVKKLGINKLIGIDEFYSKGDGIKTINLKGLSPFSPLICYEAIFPSNIIEKNHRPEWILNISKDGWYITSVGPKQHFQHVRIRAIEEGLPVVRAVNNGVSAVINSYGKVIKKLEYGSRGVIDFQLPNDQILTIYSKFGDLTFFFILLLIFTVISINHYKIKKKLELI